MEPPRHEDAAILRGCDENVQILLTPIRGFRLQAEGPPFGIDSAGCPGRSRNGGRKAKRVNGKVKANALTSAGPGDSIPTDSHIGVDRLLPRRPARPLEGLSTRVLLVAMKEAAC
jgi:hypothetical protein